ncbi:carboxypeptidase regulatory-like domain-containing protein [Cellulomonas sp. URHD0024]|uniref:carboxypeptidase regulatory-like domain-containing protein n=1 Tax=Cellulomonas sp. URHD0024 TaxID=1302620 RepID=UPI000419766E|nr:carboxypeptidase regulatory-like domain-containing protein [Cellulomonas sp. URHD0024]
MRLNVEPQRATANPGIPTMLGVVVTNASDVIAGYVLRVLGADPSWVEIEDPSPRLFPGESVSVGVMITLPVGVPAGERRVAIQVRDVTDEAAIAIEDVTLDVPPQPRTSVKLEPTTVTAGKAAAFTVLVHNEGNTVQHGSVLASDPEAKTTYTFAPATFSLAPGESTSVALEARAKRPWVGDPLLRPFELRVDSTATPVTPDTPAAAAGVFVQKSRLSRGLLSLLGLLFALTLFAVIITLALSSVVGHSAADRDLALQVAQARQAAAKTGTSAISGTVIDLSTGAPVPNVSVALFTPDDPSNPFVTTATADAGTFAISRLPAGTYLLRVTGAGLTEVWYAAAATQADATKIPVTPGQTVSGLTVVVGGVPATVAGTVVGDDVAGATLTVEMPLDTPPLAGTVTAEPGEADPPIGSGAVVRTVPIGADGTFQVEGLPSPAIYDLVVSKSGYASTVQRVDVAAGEDRSEIELSLLTGDGSIAGTVSGFSGPVGGATVVATTGQVTVETVSLTQDAVGSFVLRGLPTPGSYTVVVSADGYAPATLNLTLTAGQQLTGVSVVLGRDQASLAGQVTVPGGDAAGVTVTVTDGAVTAQTVTQSTAPAGHWEVTGLRVPSTYTVTFSRADLESQVLSVGVDGFGNVTSGAPSASQVDATMRAADASISGVVSQTASPGESVPVGNVTVSVSSGITQRTVTTASTPESQVGRYIVGQLPPGTYTVTFSRPGTRPTSTIVVLSAAQDKILSPLLVAPARITGTVTSASEISPSGRAVLLFRATEYGSAAPAVASTTTGPDGSYTLDDVDAPENYIVEVRASPTGAVLVTSQTFPMSASEQKTVNLVIGTPP